MERAVRREEALTSRGLLVLGQEGVLLRVGHLVPGADAAAAAEADGLAVVLDGRRVGIDRLARHRAYVVDGAGPLTPGTIREKGTGSIPARISTACQNPYVTVIRRSTGEPRWGVAILYGREVPPIMEFSYLLVSTILGLCVGLAAGIWLTKRRTVDTVDSIKEEVERLKKDALAEGETVAAMPKAEQIPNQNVETQQAEQADRDIGRISIWHDKQISDTF